MYFLLRQIRSGHFPALAGLLLVPLAAAIGFHAYTGGIWEDFFITFRHTENLVQGNGLVYQPGERVHGFTSVLNTLLPALPLLFSDSLTVALRFYQACSLIVMLTGLAALLRAMQLRQASGFWELALVVSLIATSIKILAFSTNGQEGGLLVGFLSLALAATLRLDEPRQWIILAAAFSGLLYTRPDSPVYLAIVWGISLSMAAKPRAIAARLGRATGCAFTAFLPWILFTWFYYGTPIPHTITAKSTGHILAPGGLRPTLQSMWTHWFQNTIDIFGPIYQPGGWPEWILAGMTLAGIVVSLYWAVPVRDRFGRACSGGIFLLMGYLSWVSTQRMAYPWYFVPLGLLGAIVAARGLGVLLSNPSRMLRGAGIASAAALLVLCAACTALGFNQWRIQQQEIEEQTRKAVGLFLRKNVKPAETVYLEPIGYIGYYFGGKIFDYPGLVSPEVVKILRNPAQRFATVPVVLRPTWIVARPGEAHAILEIPENQRAYDVIAQIDARKRLDHYGEFAGKALLEYDAVFHVLRRKEVPRSD